MKTVLITGGSKRLGRALVEHFDRQGWRVLFTCRTSFEEGIALADSLGKDVHCARADVSTQSSAAAVAKWVRQHTDRLDLIVCNASTFKRAAIAETTPGDFADLLGSNLLGPFFLVQQCMDLLEETNGCVVNVADSQALGGVEMFTAYVAAKAALISITKSMSVELAPHIRVNAVLPGSLPWPETGDTYPPAAREAIVANIPMGELGRWCDVVHTVAYLESARYVTGACASVDGGRSALF